MKMKLTMPTKNPTGSIAQHGKTFLGIASLWARFTSLTYPTKFTLIALIFTLPLIAFAPLALEQSTRIEQYGRKELYGTLYLRATQKLLADVLAHQFAAKEYFDGEAPLSQVKGIQSQVDADFQALEVIQARYGSALRLSTDEVQVLKVQWQTLITDLPSLDEAESNTRHAQLTAATYNLITKVGDTSFLILDPDLDTYYMMDAVLLKLPENQALRFQTLLIAEEAAHHQALSPEEKAQLTILTGQLKTNLSALNRNIEASLTNNASGAMRPIVTAPLETYVANTTAFIEMIENRLINSPTITLSPDELVSMHESAKLAESKFYESASQALEIGVQARINNLSIRLYSTIAVALFSVLAAFLIGLTIMHAISRPLSNLIETTSRLAKGDLTARATVTSSDEVGQVGNAFNAMVAELQESYTSLAEKEQRYRTTLDGMLEGCQIIGFDWRYLYLNPAAEIHNRRPNEKLLGQKYMDIWPGIEATEMFVILQRCMAERTAHQMENEFVFPDGTRGWFSFSIQPVPEGIFILSMDITERQLAKEDNELQLQRLHALREIDLAIMGSTNMYLSLQAVLEQVLAQLDVDAADILLLNPYTQILGFVAGRGFRSKHIEQTHIRIGQGMEGRAALGEETQHIPNLASVGDEFVRTSLIAEEGFTEYYALPLTAKGSVNGLLEVFQRQPSKPDANWLDFLHVLAGQASIAIDNSQLFSGLHRANQDLLLAYNTTIEGWSYALDLRDKETEGHTLRVTEIAMRLARIAEMTEAELVHVRRGALLHDIGKMGVPDHILLKAGTLTDEEWVAMRKHPTFAFELLSPIAYLRRALDIPYCHHEKWDGSGYPRGLKGEQIPLAARLFAVVDVWDALRSDRSYREGWPKEKVIKHIKSLSGTHFDPKMVELFLSMINEL